MGIIDSVVSSKKGKLYFRFILAAAFYSYSALAAVPSATPAIVNTNGTTVNDAFTANVRLAGATGQLNGWGL